MKIEQAFHPRVALPPAKARSIQAESRIAPVGFALSQTQSPFL
ncbi:hypothetical protein ACPOL_1317 [Acidisarcina polymorpha]|uniref:Uncharacterized protein n=1 Tax=Acidisarcina polymorpha TaxID=2211140 RepID=A0A2Z5FWA3_9BACT|nr:hypothetical protein [Acidisarcina polymorpha]AXC10665.1 hypothetical protein ACPOL_1317 [Acidisarcina polymorpha]